MLGGAIDAGQARQAPVQLVDRRLGARADIRDAGRFELHPARDRVGNISDVDVVARLLPVAVDDARLAGEEPRREDGNDAGLARRILAGSVDVRQAQGQRAAARHSGPAFQISLGGDLRHSIGRRGLQRMILWSRQDTGVPVAGPPGRSVQDLPNRRASARLEQRDRAQDVDARVADRVRDRSGNRGLGGHVDDDFGPSSRQDRFEPHVAKITDVKLRGGMHAVAPSRRQVVENVHRVPVRDQSIYDVRTDESSAAGDEDPQEPSFLRNQSTVSRSPSSVSTRGSHPSSVRARPISGWRTFGSSTGSERNTISLRDAVRRMIRLASSSNVISWGFPILTGSLTGACMSRQRPSMRSLMYWNERVWAPSPKTVMGTPVSAWLMNAGMARPSLSRMRVPKVLKILTMRVSIPCVRWYAMVIASPNRLASS